MNKVQPYRGVPPDTVTGHENSPSTGTVVEAEQSVLSVIPPPDEPPEVGGDEVVTVTGGVDPPEEGVDPLEGAAEVEGAEGADDSVEPAEPAEAVDRAVDFPRPVFVVVVAPRGAVFDVVAAGSDDVGGPIDASVGGTITAALWSLRLAWMPLPVGAPAQAVIPRPSAMIVAAIAGRRVHALIATPLCARPPQDYLNDRTHSGHIRQSPSRRDVSPPST
jgi:hypothetical protein